ncbi:glycosyltransferase family 2 protein [Paenibacillus whitsoniae]|uniref:Glycosyltransferase family 2 protein n=2 Tax=Paenibacillus whitsoniae TaxID=2496558 RepID=A0A430JBE7_9BACL|nr:glycosyltransferase family A protein [Paenibacillus whitsoniae]RTE08342.1 glycosyltransferase family 2 protein [Paenibacillus whitsoniae]
MMSEQPLVSVIIPTYNRRIELAELAESLYRQTYKHLQIIIVNDCGPSVDFICDLYPELHIEIVNMPTNQKHVAARNRGLQEVRGDYIMLCDDDDLLLPMHTERMLAEIQDCDLVYPDVEIFNYAFENNARIITNRFLFAYEFDIPAMRRFSTFFSSGCLFRPALIKALGGFDEEMFHYWDWDFFLRAVQDFRVKRAPIASVLYAFAQDGQSNMSGQHDSMRPFLDLLSAKHGLGELPTKNFFLLLEEPEVKARQAQTEIVWDRQPIRSRLTV